MVSNLDRIFTICNLERSNQILPSLGNGIFKSIFFIAILFFSNPSFAGYLDSIDGKNLPREVSGKIYMLRQIEPYVQAWQAEWPYTRSKENIKDQLESYYDETAALIEKMSDNGELLLLGGLIAFYGYNLDIEGSFDRAVICFTAAEKMLPDDYRPLWFLGMHLSKATHYTKGMELLLEAESRFNINEPIFWEDYALTAYFTVMPQHALVALEKVKELRGEKSRLDDVVGAKIREVSRTPKANEQMEIQDLWDLKIKDHYTGVTSFPFGYKFTAMKKDSDDFQFISFNGKHGTIKIRLTPRMTETKETYIPCIHIITFIAQEDETLDAFAKNFLNPQESWKTYDMKIGLNEVSYMGESREFYKDAGGARTLMTCFERNKPKISRLLLEEPKDELENAEAGIYGLRNYYNRFEERLFYIIWLEAPVDFFDDAFLEFKDIIKTFIVE